MTSPTAATHKTNLHLTLRALIDILIPGTSVTAKKILNEDLTKEKYITYLIDLYHMVIAVCPMMQTAADELRKRGHPNDLLVAAYLEHHRIEELDHDLWLLQDLANLGVDKETVLSFTPKTEIINMVGSVYYRIFHIDPVALLGYLAIGETYPVSNSIIDTIMSAIDVGPQCVDTLRRHTVIDVDHSADFYEFISSMDWSEQQKQSIHDCAKATIFYMIDVGETLA